jgi:anti-sigma B factor antagonist
MAMTMTERRVGDVTILDLTGRLVLDEGDAMLRARVNGLIDQSRLKIVVNMQAVTYVDSCGVGALVEKYVSVRRQGGDVKLLHLTPRSRRILEITGLLNVFEAYNTEAEAVSSFTAGQGAS